ncbi:OadG family protein [Crateriforma spongiae]|uniref:OadG family protein n=1 Tax=Crateriforma spongiae TaxID=2724528 RepID=UPI001F1C21D9|nr:OadG family protein [Crateriforma spongiae]
MAPFPALSPLCGSVLQCCLAHPIAAMGWVMPIGLLQAADTTTGDAVPAVDGDAPSAMDTLFSDFGIPLAILGMVVVFMALIILMMVITAMPRLIALMEGKPGKSSATDAKTKSATSPVPDDADDDELTPELVAVLTAAVAATERRPVRIVRTRRLTPSELAWTLEGRIRHHASHRLQPRNR